MQLASGRLTRTQDNLHKNSQGIFLTEEGIDDVAYCGLHCGGCFSYKGTIADMARDLRKELRSERFDQIASGIPFKEFEHYDECYEVLGAMVRLRCNSKCRGGGGNPSCNIRRCAQRKEIDGCWECQEFEECKKLDTLRKPHGIAHISTIRRLKNKGLAGFMDGKIEYYLSEKK